MVTLSFAASVCLFSFAVGIFALSDNGQDDPTGLTNCTISCLADPSSINRTQLCESPDLRDSWTNCAIDRCTHRETIGALNTQALICQDARRTAKSNLFGVAVLQAIGVVCVTTRLVERRKLSGGFYIDDWLMVVTLIIYIPASIVVLAMWVQAFGFDVWTLNEDVIIRSRMFFYLAELFYVTQLATTKASMICFQLRIFRANDAFRLTARIALTALAILTTTIVVLVIIQTNPLNWWWDGWLDSTQHYFPGSHKRIDIFGGTTAVVAFNIAFDFIIFVMPIPLVLRLQMRPRTKAGVSVMFGFGVLITACSCVRMWTNFAVPSFNFTWDYVPGLAWGTAECGMSYIVTSLPTLHIVWGRQWKPRLEAYLARRRNESGESGGNGEQAVPVQPGNNNNLPRSQASRRQRARMLTSEVLGSLWSTRGSQHPRPESLPPLPESVPESKLTTTSGSLAKSQSNVAEMAPTTEHKDGVEQPPRPAASGSSGQNMPEEAGIVNSEGKDNTNGKMGQEGPGAT